MQANSRIKKIDLLKSLRKTGSSLLRYHEGKTWALFEDPVEIIQSEKLEDVGPILKKIGRTKYKNLHCCLFVPYDAARSFDPALEASISTNIPLVWAAFYKAPRIFLKLNDIPDSDVIRINTQNEILKKAYLKKISQIKLLIKNGDTYQVNFTFRTHANFSANAEEYFLSLFKFHQPEYAAFINTGKLKILSLSPELFIMKKSNVITSLPMKGTAARMPNYDDDIAVARSLSLDPKNRAENIMITDMVRNDLGKISKTGSVKTTTIFNVLTTMSVHQMVSKVEASLNENLSLMDIFQALFPPASITGTPKIRSTQIIHDLEKSPRGIYTGTIGHVKPNGDFIFNVAIRTATIKNKILSAGIGGGIVADSNPIDEWNEAILKSSFLNCNRSGFKIFETILFKKKHGYLWLNEHLKRLANSQKYFLRSFNEKKIIESLMRISQKLPQLARVKISLSPNGEAEIQWNEISSLGWQKKDVTIMISKIRTSSKNILLYHKTDERKIYDTEFHNAQLAGYEEVIFANERDEITEGAITNLFVKKKKGWVTPPLRCGLLPGIWRAKMLKKLNAKEQVIGLEEFMSEKKIIIGNSVRGLTAVKKKSFNFF